MNLSLEDQHRFWAKVETKSPVECWPWLDSTNGHGNYGQLRLGGRKGRTYYAHRISFYLKHGYLPAKPNLVMHDCENPRCVNPNHLLEGTYKENNNYPEHRKNLGPPISIAKRIKFMNESRQRIKAEIIEARNSGVQQKVLAAKYGISDWLVGAIYRGERWLEPCQGSAK